ncbi:MAG: hypothetical protein EOP74_00915 [Variovorax sp.]|nr:MAG: hypothetical protein EOP74_00915 [Variovorax sp.]
MNTAVASPISVPLGALRVGWIALGAVAAMRVNLVGEIYVGELLALAALPFILLRRRLDRNVAYLIIIALIWSIGQFVSDIVNQTEFNSMLKGVLAPLVFAATVCGVTFLFERYPRRIASLLMGVSLTLLISVILKPTPEQIFQPWKWGYGSAILGIGLVWLSFFKGRSVAVTIGAILAFSAICIVQNARSLAMIPATGLLAYLFWHYSFGAPFKRWLTGRFGALKVVLLIVGATWLLNMALTVFFASGVIDPFLAPEVALKYHQQASTEVGLLLAGRSESLILIRAFLDSPLVGHGSWAVDKSGYIDQWIQLIYQYGISDSQAGGGGIDGSLIPAHSYLLGAMVWAGIAGGAFWILFTFRIISSYLKFARQLPIYFHVGLVNFLWNLLFSPFGAEGRWALAVFAAALFACCAQLTKARNIALAGQ